MDYKAVPAFLADAADALLTFLVLTASRLSPATGADWSEIDGNVWTIPAGALGARNTRSRCHGPRWHASAT